MVKDMYFEKLRGLAILAVVLIHASTRGVATIQLNKFNGYFILTLRQIIAFAVPLFLFISGYFAYKSKSFNILNRLKRIILPYLFWSLLSIFVLNRIDVINVKNIIYVLFTGQATSIYYYLIVMVQLISLTPLLKKIIDKKWKNIVYLISFIYIIIYYILTIKGIDIKYPFNVLFFFTWITFYFHGMVVSSNKGADKRISIIFLIFILSLSVLESMYWVNCNNISLAVSQIKITSMLFSLSFINFLIYNRVYLEKFKAGDKLIILGKYSFGIYLIHIFLLPKIQSLLSRIHILYSVQIAYIVFCSIICLIICLAIIRISIKIFGKSISRKYFGF